MPATLAPRNFDVISLRRRGFSTTRTPTPGVIRPAGRNPTLQLTTTPGDQPVTGMPFTEGFESGTDGNWQTNVGFQFTQTEHYQGNWSSFLTAVNGVGSDKYLEYNFADHPTINGIAVGQRDIYLKFAHKWGNNWVDGSYQGLQKLMLLNSHNPASGARRHQLTFNMWTPDGGYFCEFLRLTEQGAFNGSSTPNVALNFFRQLGVWQEFVFRVRMNTLGQQDGILQIWTKTEGDSEYTLRVDRFNINYRDSNNFSPNRLIQSNYQPETTLSGNRYWDTWTMTEEAIDVSPNLPASDWPLHVPGYTSLLPGVGGYGMNTPAGAGRGTGTTVIFVDSLNTGNSGGAIDSSLSAYLNWPTATFRGTAEYAARHAASPKVILPVISGIATLQASIPNQTGSPPRPGLTTYYGQSAPNPGLVLRGCNWVLNGGDGHAVWHMKSWMGDDATGVGVANRDCLASGYQGGLTQQIVLINCEFQWSIDELVDFYRVHSQVSFVNCAFIEPLHISTIVHPEDGAGVDHGFGPIIGGDTSNPTQPSSISTFRCLWAHTTARNPYTNATTFVHANNLHYNHGRPTGVNADGNAVHLFSANDATFTNILGNAFVRGPNNRTNMVAVAVAASMPPGSQGYAFGNAQFGWTAPANQNAFFTSAPANYVVGGLIDTAFPESWGVGLSGVLQWAANPLAPTATEWNTFVDRMERTVGASPRWRNLTNNRIKNVFAQIRDRLNGVTQTDQFVNTVTQAGGWPTIPSVVLAPAVANAAHWHAALPRGTDRDTVYQSGTFSDGRSRVGYTRLEAWAYEQHLFVMQYDVTPPTQPPNAAAIGISITTIRVTWGASTDVGVGLAGYRVFRSTTSNGTYAQVGGDLSAATLEYQDNSLGASTTRFYRVYAFDNAGNVSAASTTVSGTTQPSAPVGEWADQYGEHSGLQLGISVAGRRYGIRSTTLAGFNPRLSNNGASLTHIPNGSFDGLEPCVEMRPPTSRPTGGDADYASILASYLHRSGQNDIAQINFRWLVYYGPRYFDVAANAKIQGFLLGPTPSDNTPGRMGTFDHRDTNWSSWRYVSVTCGTWQSYHQPPSGLFIDSGPESSKLFQMRGAPNHSASPPQIGNEWICFETRIDARRNRGNANGAHRLMYWTRDGVISGRYIEIPCNWDSNWNFANQYINSYEGLGFYFNNPGGSHPDCYTRWSHCTFAANMGINQVIGPPPGFLL